MSNSSRIADITDNLQVLVSLLLDTIRDMVARFIRYLLVARFTGNHIQSADLAQHIFTAIVMHIGKRICRNKRVWNL